MSNLQISSSTSVGVESVAQRMSDENDPPNSTSVSNVAKVLFSFSATLSGPLSVHESKRLFDLVAPCKASKTKIAWDSVLGQFPGRTRKQLENHIRNLQFPDEGSNIESSPPSSSSGLVYAPSLPPQDGALSPSQKSTIAAYMKSCNASKRRPNLGFISIKCGAEKGKVEEFVKNLNLTCAYLRNYS